MRVTIVLVGIFLMAYQGLSGQNLISSKPAKLQIFGKSPDGRDILAESTKLMITLDGQYLKGVLPVGSITSIDPVIQRKLEEISDDEVIFEIQTKEGMFAFGKAVDEKVSLEGEIYATGKERKNFMMDFVVTHKKTNVSNTFLIRGLGNLSLRNHFDIDTPVLDDNISYQFNFNLEQIKK